MSSSFGTATSSHLKRTWSGTRDNTGNRPPEGTTSTTPRSVPPLPAINGEILLQVLTHRSLRRDGVGQDFDNERLAELGKQVLDTAITATLFNRRPVLSGLEMLVLFHSIYHVYYDIQEDSVATKRENSLRGEPGWMGIDVWIKRESTMHCECVATFARGKLSIGSHSNIILIHSVRKPVDYSMHTLLGCISTLGYLKRCKTGWML